VVGRLDRSLDRCLGFNISPRWCRRTTRRDDTSNRNFRFGLRLRFGLGLGLGLRLRGRLRLRLRSRLRLGLKLGLGLGLRLGLRSRLRLGLRSRLRLLLLGLLRSGLLGLFVPGKALSDSLATHPVGLGLDHPRRMALRANAQGIAEVKDLAVGHPKFSRQLVDADVFRHVGPDVLSSRWGLLSGSSGG